MVNNSNVFKFWIKNWIEQKISSEIVKVGLKITANIFYHKG